MYSVFEISFCFYKEGNHVVHAHKWPNSGIGVSCVVTPFYPAMTTQ